MEIKAATQEQIAIFKKAAAARYAERNIPADTAEALFEATMGKLATSLGIDVDKVQKPEKIEKLASEIAESLGLQRK